jgi:hypothetical protein
VDQRQQDYVDYYRARLKKYEGNPRYANSLAAEKAMFEAISGAPNLQAFKHRIEAENLPFHCAAALTKDHALARKAFYESLHEDVRARGPAQVLAALPTLRTVADLTTRATEILKRNAEEIAVDLFVELFHSDFLFLGNLEVYETAQIPARWNARRAGYVKREVDAHRAHWKNHVIPEARKWSPGWKLDYAAAWLPRHRPRFEVPDAALERRIQRHRKLVGDLF